MKTHFLFNIKINDLSDQELDELFFLWLKEDKAKVVVTPNPEFILLARHDQEFAQLLNQADLALLDGVGLEYAVAALTNSYLEHRHTGVDTVDRLVKTGERAAFIGGRPEVTKKAIEILKNKYPNTDIVMIDPGEVSTSGSPTQLVIEELCQKAPKILAVALGQGKQERFIAKILPQLPNVRIAIGIGGALDMIAGLKPRAPRLMRQIGLEWLWRLFIEPKRCFRIFRAVIVFPALVVWATLLEHKFWRACWRIIKIWLK